VAFCQWLTNDHTGTYRLPTEAEWEYACRAGSTTRWYFGDDVNDLDAHSWYRNNSLSGTKAVGQKRPNAFGLYDMYGNVRECCSDWSAQDYYGLSPIDDPGGPPSGTLHVVRGGAFYYQPEDIRSASRISLAPDYRNIGVGFRPARMCP